MLFDRCRQFLLLEDNIILCWDKLTFVLIIKKNKMRHYSYFFVFLFSKDMVACKCVKGGGLLLIQNLTKRTHRQKSAFLMHPNQTRKVHLHTNINSIMGMVLQLSTSRIFLVCQVACSQSHTLFIFLSSRLFSL